MNHMGMNIVWVGLGGMVGSILRYLVNVGCERLIPGLPAGTFFVNTAGCFIIGGLTVALGVFEQFSPAARLLLMTGFCGGFTTMSTLVFQVAYMSRTGDFFVAALYVAATLVFCFIAFYGGIFAARVLLR